jgi:hypothetical protein
MTFVKVTTVTLKTPLLAPGVALLLAACAADPSVSIEALPDARIVDARTGGGDVYLDPDRGPVADARPVDALPVLPDAGDAGLDALLDAATDGGADALAPDAGPPRPPAGTDVVIIPQAADTWIAWRRNGELRVRCLKAEACRAPRTVATVGDSPYPLRGAGTQAGIPWVVANDPVTGEARIHDIKNLVNGAATALPLGLFGPVTLGVTGLQPRPEVVAVGRTAAEAGAPLGWRRVNNESRNALRALITDFGGRPEPVSISALNDGAVFAFATGQCLKLTTEANPDRVQARDTWSCGLGPQAFLAGKTDALFTVSRVPELQQLRLSLQAPGHADDGVDATRRVDLPGVAAAWDTDYPRFDDGGLVRTTDGVTTSFWVIRTRQAARFDLVDPALVVAVAPVGAEYRLLTWDEASRNLADAVMEPSATSVPPTYAAPRACGRLNPETCDTRDNDCNEQTDEGLCCVGHGNRASSAGVPPRGGIDQLGAVGISDDGLVYVARQLERVFALRYPSDDATRAPMTERGGWDGYGRILLSTTKRSNALVVAEVSANAALPADAGVPVADAAAPPADAGMPADAAPPAGLRVDLLWLQGLTTYPAVEAPCAPVVAVRFHADAQRVRMYCPDTAWDIGFGEASGAEVPYPVGTSLRWVSRSPFGDTSLTLVARGDDHALSLWRDDDLGGIALIEEPLPLALNNLLPAERDLPIRIPGAADATPVRVGVDRALEALLPNGSIGWTRLSSANTVIDAVVSETEAVAYSVGFTTAQDVIDPRVGFFVHDLRAGAQPWGVRLDLGDSEDQGAADISGIAVSSFPPSPAAVDLPRFYRVVGGQYTIEGFALTCSPR